MKKLAGALILVVGLLTGPATALDTSFHRVQLAHGISLEIPSHWEVLSRETRQNLEATGESISKNAGVDVSGLGKVNLLAVNATPYPTGAMIRVSITSPSEDNTQAAIAAVTPADLTELGIEVLNMFKKAEGSGGVRIIHMQPCRIEKVNNQLAIVLSYIRAGLKGPSPWSVTQYKIPVSKRIIEITLSHRQSDAVVWEPILEKVKRSVRF